MRLIDLIERQNTDTIWYHGTPETHKLEQGFEGRTEYVSYITDPELWMQMQQQMQQLTAGLSDSNDYPPEYWKLIDEVAKLRTEKAIRKPVFLSDNYGVANTYADEHRAFDYQNAQGGVVKVRVRPGKTLEIYAGGENFRGISLDAVRRGLKKAGIGDEQIEKELAHYTHQVRGNGNQISTNILSAVVDDLGFDIIDVQSVKDTYMGGGPNATVRMVMDHNLIDIIRD